MQKCRSIGQHVRKLRLGPARSHARGVHGCTAQRAAGARAQFLQDFKVPSGEFLLSNAANSVLGRELIQMARRHGTRLINVVRRRELVGELRKQGCAGSASAFTGLGGVRQGRSTLPGHRAPGSGEVAAAAAVSPQRGLGAHVLRQQHRRASQRQGMLGTQRRRCQAIRKCRMRIMPNSTYW